jgi:hypothetical protein
MSRDFLFCWVNRYAWLALLTVLLHVQPLIYIIEGLAKTKCLTPRPRHCPVLARRHPHPLRTRFPPHFLHHYHARSWGYQTHRDDVILALLRCALPSFEGFSRPRTKSAIFMHTGGYAHLVEHAASRRSTCVTFWCFAESVDSATKGHTG